MLAFTFGLSRLRQHFYYYWTNYLHGQPLEYVDSPNGVECIPSNGVERRGIRDEKALSDLGCSWHEHSTSGSVCV